MNVKSTSQHLIKHSFVYALFCAFILFWSLHFLALPKITDKTVERISKEKPHAILFPHAMPDFCNPWNVPDNMPADYLYTITIDYHALQQTRFYLYPTGCVDEIRLNGTPINYDRKPSCSRDGGFAIDLAPVLRPGQNTLKITLSNVRVFHHSRGWDAATYGLDFGSLLYTPQNFGLSSILSLLLIASICTAIISLLKHFTGEYISGALVSSGLLMYLRQVKLTSYMNYVIDMPSHLHYICYIATHGFPPKPMEGWEYYHPPLYYEICAKIMLWCNWLGSFDALNMIRLFSVACFMVCIIFCTLILRRIISNPLAYYPVLIMLLFYPSSIYYAPRIDSHLLLYCFYAGCLYFLMRWILENRPLFLWLALVCFGLGIAARSNALVLAPLIGLAGLYQLATRRFVFSQILSFGMTISLCVIAFGLLHNFGRTAHFHEVDHNAMPYVVGNISNIDQRQYIPNNIENFMFLNTQLLLNPPFLDWWHDNTGRQYFWNTVLKTSLFEHFWWRSPLFAKRVLALLLTSIAYIFTSLCWMRIAKRKEWNMCCVTLLISLIMLMANRYNNPYAPSQDFRYIFPSITGFLGMIGLVIEQHLARRQYKSGLLGIIIVLWFSLSSIGLILAG